MQGQPIILAGQSQRDYAKRMIDAAPAMAVVEIGEPNRSIEQNRLQRFWCSQVSMETGEKPEEVRGYIKLHFGVPIMREVEKWRAAYDLHIRPLPYQTKLAMMMEPFDFPVTRAMTVKQKTKYLDDVYQHYASNGIALTLPPPKELRNFTEPGE